VCVGPLATRRVLRGIDGKRPGDGYIFHSERDSQTPFIFENIIQDCVKPTLKKKGIEWHGMHAFRPGLATELDKAGVGDLTTDQVLRHTPHGSDVAGRHCIKPDAQKIRRFCSWLRKNTKQSANDCRAIPFCRAHSMTSTNRKRCCLPTKRLPC
jgi:integrase